MEIVLLWCFVLAWMAKRGAEDLVHAVKGTPNPRYELRKQRARGAGARPAAQPRYGTREWFGDLYSDALVAHTERRRKSAAAKAQPIDDLAEAVREPQPARAPVFPSRPVGDIGDEDWCEKHQMPRMRQGVWENGPRSRFCPCAPRVEFQPPETPEDEGLDLRIAEAKKQIAEAKKQEEEAMRCPDCGAPNPFGTPCQQHNPSSGDDSPTARIYLFPTINQLKEIDMSNEANGLTHAIAYANVATNAHQSFAAGGAETYVAALENGGMKGEALSSAREAMEASGTAAEKWAAHRAKLEDQMTVKDAYLAQPDAADKDYLLRG
ncbi:hypothetical protein O7598_31105 [Micromonospora sp. WMMC241]|uniref:hypothetical protein n=1 Tax=Micromonospora sp. WMMC241 TaxID=3015159 RepID=UPI0022B5E852|nr:hypothetical protein [Micromonospora sp. WMMC241]MCZ7440799.1 hypothetical protein [Micromonospora sp. WMMC241]MCZ7440874.1 hypothetical protein [Micromonospora sp. WMMC241]